MFETAVHGVSRRSLNAGASNPRIQVGLADSNDPLVSYHLNYDGVLRELVASVSYPGSRSTCVLTSTIFTSHPLEGVSPQYLGGRHRNRWMQSWLQTSLRSRDTSQGPHRVCLSERGDVIVAESGGQEPRDEFSK